MRISSPAAGGIVAGVVSVAAGVDLESSGFSTKWQFSGDK